MAPATKQKKWCKADNKKLRELVNQPGNNITLSATWKTSSYFTVTGPKGTTRALQHLFEGSWRS
jgi:hypothetical protein